MWWLRLILEYVARMLPIALPLFLPTDYLPSHAHIRALFAAIGLSDPTDAQVRGVGAMVGLMLVFVFDFFNLYLPKEEARRFAKLFFDRLVYEFSDEDAPAFGSDLRMNVLFIRAPRWIGKRILPLRWAANVGFAPAFGNNSDAHFWIWGFQGVCGRAIRKGFPQFSDLRGEIMYDRWSSMVIPWRVNFRFFRWQIRRTAHVKAVLSVPIHAQTAPSPNPKMRLLGVVNLDAVSDGGADWLVKTHKGTAEYLCDQVQFLAYLK